jgi:hypothetical protein
MSKTLLRHTLITKIFLTFLLTPYLYTFSLYENPSFIIFSAETKYISTRSWYRNFPNMCSNIPASPAYGVYISQLIRYARTSSNYSDFLKHHLHLRNRLFVDSLIFMHFHYMKMHRLSSSLQRRYIFRQDLGIGI